MAYIHRTQAVQRCNHTLHAPIRPRFHAPRTLLMSALSDLLSRAHASLSAKAGLPAPLTLFISMTDGSERAHTARGVGETFEAAWQAATQAAQQLANRHKLAVCWLRVDWPTHVQATTMGQLQKRLERTKRSYFRYGISLDAELKQAILEPEVNALAMLYPGSDRSEAGINAKNFTAHVQRRFGSQAVPAFAEATPIWVFAHEGAFFSADIAMQALPAGHEPAAWLPGPKSTDARWNTPECLNAGRRSLGNLGPYEAFCLIDSSASFLQRQVQPNGQFIYGHFPCFGRFVPSYNALRHASTIYSMLEGWELLQYDDLLAAIERALGYLAKNLVRHYPQPDGSVLSFVAEDNGELKLGANAVSLLALVKYEQLTGNTRYRPLMDQLALGIAHMQNPSTGQFVHVLNSNDLSLKQAFRIVYYDGEAAFGLMRLYGLTRDPRWLQVVEKAFEYFLKADHWKHRDHWLSYCVNELTLYKPEERYFKFGVQNIAGLLDFILTRETTYPTLMELSMAFKAMLTRMQRDHPDMLHVLGDMDVDKFHRALHHRAHYLLNGFFWPELAMFYNKPSTVVGSFFIRHHAFRVRIDDIQHYLSGYVAYWRMLTGDGRFNVQAVAALEAS